MNFWERVDDLLDRKDITKKELAYKAKFSASNISKGKSNNNIPSAETAVRIAKVLGVTVEYLVNGTDSATSKAAHAHLQKEMDLFRKYRKTIEKLDALPQGAKAPIIEMIDKIDMN